MVVGGGLAGLAAALDLAEAGVEVTVVEAAPHLGGKVAGDTIDGHDLDLGADHFSTLQPWGLELCRRVGIIGHLTSPEAGPPHLWMGGRLRPLPAPALAGLPQSLGVIRRSPVLSAAARVRALAEPFLPPTAIDASTTVSHLVRHRLGPQVDAHMVEPVLAARTAWDTESLGVEAAVPALAEVAGHGGSLIRSLRRRELGHTDGSPPVLSPRKGMTDLVAATAARLGRLRVELRTGQMTEAVEPRATGVAVDGRTYDAVVLATPAHVTRRLIELSAPESATGLAAIDHASVATLVLDYPSGSVRQPLGGSGFVTRRGDGLLVNACWFESERWPHRARPGRVSFRVVVGRAGDERHLDMGDAEIVARVHDELARILGIGEPPSDTRLARWPAAMPCFGPDHHRLVASIDKELTDRIPGAVLAGATYRGWGVNAAISSGQAAARRILDTAP